MKDRVAIVTGGGQGIGRAIVERFLREGMAVVIADSDEEAGRETETDLSKAGKVLFAATEVSDESRVEATIARTIQTFGRLDVLVNNAATSRGKPVTELTREEWDRVIAVNLTGPFLCAKHAAPHLRRQGGAIVNIASTRALMSEKNTEAYSASKGGLVALTHALAVSLGPEVRVNCISPGWIEVGDRKKRSARREAKHSDADRLQHPAGRIGKPEDIAEMVFHLASDKGGFITGANFVIDGGMTRKMIYVE
jgi:NAD(P)-dependent dehydrogenase (short-subunit alcohol dehydrogenase family)